MLYSAEAHVQLAHAPGAVTFAVCIYPYVSKTDPGPDHPTNMHKLACVE